jgi:hypothetical protein
LPHGKLGGGGGGGPFKPNFAEIDLSVVGLVTLQPPVPLHAPLQPRKAEFAPAVSARENGVPELSFMLHVPGQSMPAGLDTTLPEPLPISETLMTMVFGGGGGLAALILAWAMVELRSIIEVIT